MEIEIIRTDFNCLISQEKMLWKNYIKVYLNIFILLAIAGGLCLADAVDVYSKTGILTTVTFSLAIGFFLSALINIAYPFLARQKSLKRTKQLVAQYKRQPESLTIKLSGWGVTTKAPDAASEYAWSYFTSYKIADNHILILPNHHSLINIFIDKDELPAEQFNQLVTFLNNRFPQKKSFK
jgi:hypothetical protein